MSMLLHGDTLACYGRTGASKFIRLWQAIKRPMQWARNGWRVPSHIAFCIHDIEHGTIVVESTTMSDLPDLFTKNKARGVQAHKVDEWLNTYAGRVEVFRLKVPQTPTSRQRMSEYVMRTLARQAEYDTKGAIGSALDVVRNTEDGEKLFCSEFHAFAFQKGGSISNAINCSEVNPLRTVSFKCLEFSFDPRTR